MPRIDAPIATQVADFARPNQTYADTRLQAEAARVSAQRSEATVITPDAPSADVLQQSAQRLKQVVEAASGRQLSFSIDEDSRSLLVKITEQNTGKVLRQIPSEEVLDLHRRLDALVGLIIDKTA